MGPSLCRTCEAEARREKRGARHWNRVTLKLRSLSLSGDRDSLSLTAVTRLYPLTLGRGSIPPLVRV